MSNLVTGITSLVSAIAAVLAAWHAIQGSKKGTQIKANVNGNLERLVQILAESAITIPHDTAAKVISAPPVDIPDDASTDERLALEFLAKLKDTK